MSFRAKLLIVIVVTVVASVGLVAWTVSSSTRRAFEELDSQRTAALVEQFRREFARRGADVDNRVHGMAETEATLRMAIDLSRPNPDYSLYVTDSRGLALSHQLDFVELAEHDGVIFSSSHWPGRFGTRNEWVSPGVDWKSLGAFLMREDFPAPGGAEGAPQASLVLVAVRQVGVGEKKIFVIVGRILDRDFLASLVLPAGMRALLYRNLQPAFSPAELLGAAAPVEHPEKLAALIERVRRESGEASDTVTWTSDPASAETFHALPLKGRDGELLGILLVGGSRRELVEMQEFIRSMAVVAGAFGLLLGVAISWWAAARVTRPVEKLAQATRSVAFGNWGAQVDVQSRDEMGDLAQAFNQMTLQLGEQRERLVQAERVAAWRELARRLAHELKNPLHPLQITIENLQRARQAAPEQFDEVFRESTTTLLAELENLKGIVARFSDFAKMPAPQLQAVNVNEVVRDAVRLFESQFSAPGRVQILPEMYFAESIATIQADPQLLQRALQNLVLNAHDAMPDGGRLTIRTKNAEGGVRIEVGDTGSGLTPEECARLFTPYYTTKHYGTGLGLAIVQSVVSDHGGKISVESEEKKGTTFVIELPARPPSRLDARKEHATADET